MNFQEELDKAFEALKAGKTILYPTDTVWGLGCDASNEEVVKRIYEIKGKDKKALIILIADISQLRDYVSQIPEVAWDIVDYAEEPLTVIYPKGKKVAENLLADDGSIAIRLVKDEFCKKLIQKFRKAIVSTSANLSGMPTPKGFKEINEKIISNIDHVVNLRQNEVSNAKSSTIIRLELNGEIKFIRK